jgi:hypothetical protein
MTRQKARRLARCERGELGKGKFIKTKRIERGSGNVFADIAVRNPWRALFKAELADDLLRRELRSSWHLSPSFDCDRTRILAPSVASFKGGRARRRDDAE